VVEDLVASLVGEGDELAGHEVIFDLEKSDVLTAAPDEARIYYRVRRQADQVEVAQLATEQFYLLMLNQVLK